MVNDKHVNARVRAGLEEEWCSGFERCEDTAVWESNSTSTAARKAELFNTGNFILKDRKVDILWQSFDFPTNTVLAF